MKTTLFDINNHKINPLNQSQPTINVLSAYAASNDANHAMSPNIPNNVRSTNEEQSQRLAQAHPCPPTPTD